MVRSSVNFHPRSELLSDRLIRTVVESAFKPHIDRIVQAVSEHCNYGINKSKVRGTIGLITFEA
jgi:hypothetical protein